MDARIILVWAECPTSVFAGSCFCIRLLVVGDYKRAREVDFPSLWVGVAIVLCVSYSHMVCVVLCVLVSLGSLANPSFYRTRRGCHYNEFSWKGGLKGKNYSPLVKSCSMPISFYAWVFSSVRWREPRVLISTDFCLFPPTPTSLSCP